MSELYAAPLSETLRSTAQTMYGRTAAVSGWTVMSSGPPGGGGARAKRGGGFRPLKALSATARPSRQSRSYRLAGTSILKVVTGASPPGGSVTPRLAVVSGFSSVCAAGTSGRGRAARGEASSRRAVARERARPRTRVRQPRARAAPSLECVAAHHFVELDAKLEAHLLELLLGYRGEETGEKRA